MKRPGLRQRLAVNGYREKTVKQEIQKQVAAGRTLAVVTQDYNGVLLELGHHYRRQIDCEESIDKLLPRARALEEEARQLGAKEKKEAPEPEQVPSEEQAAPATTAPTHEASVDAQVQ